MARSFYTSVATGSSDTVEVPFPYISRDHVHISLDGDLVADNTLTWLSAGMIELPITPQAGVIIKVYRETPADDPLVQFSPGVLDHRDLNRTILQVLYVAQETLDVVDTVGEAAELVLQIEDLLETVQEMLEEAEQLTTPGDGTVTVAKLAADALQLIAEGGSEAAVRGQFEGVNEQTGPSYTLVLDDRGKIVERNRATANTTTVPRNSAVTFPLHTVVHVAQAGDGASSLVADDGVTLLSYPDGALTLAGKGGMCSLMKVAINTWRVVGAMVV